MGLISGVVFTLFSSQRKTGPEKVFEEILAENFSNLEKESDIPVQDKPKKTTLTHVL